MSDLRLGRLAMVVASVGLCSGMALGQTPTAGPDVIVGDLPDISNNPVNGLYDSVAVGTNSCNKGNTPLNWFTGGTDNRHPAISQNIYRYTPANGRFEQLGQGQLKHGFTALQGSICASYFGFGCTQNPNGTALGVGCSDPYGSGLNNVLGSGGPKWQVNAATGLFPYPPAVPANAGPARVRVSDLNAGVTGGVRFFIEGQYIVGDDSAAGNKNNNASWREMNFSPTAGAVPNATEFAASLTPGQVVHREQAGIYAWQAIDPTVTITTFDVPSDGRFILGCKVSGPTAGLYTYEYALYNMNSHRCAGSFIVPLPAAHNALTAAGFHDVDIVGEPNALGDPSNPASDDWGLSGTDANAPYVSWAGQAYNGTPPVYVVSATVPFKVDGFTPGTGNDHTANVIRWGEMFNFRFTSEVGPGAGSVAVGLWRPGTSSYFTMNVRTPGGSTVGSLTGACCASNACTLISQNDCTTGGGVWGLPGSSCTPNPCVAGSCCLSGVCTSTLLTGCTGAWTSGAACQPNPCPIPTGACCSNNTCAIAQAPSCVGTGLTYQGDGTACASVTCPQGNDGCSSAVALCDGVASNGTNVAATVDGTASCANSATTPDVWYSYIPATTGTVVVDTCTASYDSAISVRTGNCPGTAEVGCDDDACGSLHSRVSVAMTAGTRYLIRVSGYNGNTGTFSVKVTGGGGQGCNPTGACCTGTTCSSATQAACAGTWQGAASTCGPVGNPTTCCPANYNQTGGLGVQDIFDYLNAWFAASPTTDFNHVDGITVQDIFDYLNAWFAGC